MGGLLHHLLLLPPFHNPKDSLPSKPRLSPHALAIRSPLLLSLLLEPLILLLLKGMWSPSLS